MKKFLLKIVLKVLLFLTGRKYVYDLNNGVILLSKQSIPIDYLVSFDAHFQQVLNKLIFDQNEFDVYSKFKKEKEKEMDQKTNELVKFLSDFDMRKKSENLLKSSPTKFYD